MLSRKGDGKLIKRKKRKDIQALRSRTRRKSSLGIRSVRKSPLSVRNLFGKVSLCAFGKEIKEQVKKVLEDEKQVRGAYDRLYDQKLIDLFKNTFTIEKKELSYDEFFKKEDTHSH